MEKIYGYKQKDIIGLANYLNNNDNNNLSSVFEQYALISGKAKGTIRNLYYALAKMSAKDDEFCNKYLGGKKLQVIKIKEFNEEEERNLIKKILLDIQKGKSVRSSIMLLANSDGKVALRYQNKYRNALKNKPQLIEEIWAEISKDEMPSKTNFVKTENYLTDANFAKLKSEINNLVAKIALKEKKENAFLKEKIVALEKENLRLYNALYNNTDTIKFFRRNGQSNVLNWFFQQKLINFKW